MPRDGSGNYTLPAGNPVVPGTVIAATWANTTMPDIASALTNSLSRNGQGGMLAPLQFADGSFNAPSITFTQQPTLGIYRNGDDILGIAGQGGNIALFNGATGNVTVTNQVRANAATPVGASDLTRMDYVDAGDAALQADIDTNAADIATNAADIATNAAAIAALPPPKVTFLTASNPAWVPTVGVKAIQFILTGPGGGGGGVDGQGASTGASSAGGSAGATCIKSTTIIDASYNITLPAGGLGGAAGNNSGIDAANATLVSTTLNLVAGGGLGGQGIAGGTGQTRGATVGGLATGGDINLPGGDGAGSTVVNSRPAGLSTSGSSYWSQGRGSREQSTGRDGIYGAGGGAVFSVNEAANYAGGNGGVAVCQITEYF